MEQKETKQKELISKLIKAANIITESKNGQGCYIQIMPSEITKMAEEKGISFNEIEEQKIWALKEANIAYRNGKPIVSDKVYDAEYDKLFALYPDNDFFTHVGFKPVDKDRERKL